MPAPQNILDTEPDGRGRRPPWWRRALAAVIRTLGRGIGGRGNREGTYRGLGREARQAVRERRPGDLFR